MASVIKRIIMLAFIIGGIFLIWQFFIPYLKDLTKQTLTERLSREIIGNDRRALEVAFYSERLQVDLAVTEIERNRGLGGKLFLDEDRGMLFVFPKADYYSIWMKDMLFSIDIAWLDEEFRIIDMQTNVSPSTYPKSFEPDFPAKYILEVNAGYFEAHKISLGDTLSLIE